MVASGLESGNEIETRIKKEKDDNVGGGDDYLCGKDDIADDMLGFSTEDEKTEDQTKNYRDADDDRKIF